jgi:hypothetical protein
VATATTHKGWVAVKAIRRARSRPTAATGNRRWVAVKARRVGVEPEADAPPRDVPRVEIVDDSIPAPPPTRALPTRSRAIRITRVKSNGRRRWSVDFLVRRQDELE